MKRCVVLLLSLLALVFVSCEGPMGPPGEPSEGFDPFVETFDIPSQAWERFDSNDYVHFYKCMRDIDIGNRAYNRGFVNVYLYQLDNGDEIQTPLPYWMQYSDRGNTWLEGYNFDFDSQTIVFYVDWRKDERPPACKFRIVVAP